MPNSREWAMLIWTVAFFSWGLSRPSVRSAFRNVAKTALHPKLLVPVIGLFLWVTGEILIGRKLGLWNESLVTDTFIWLIASGLILFGKFDDVSKPMFFRRNVKSILGVTVLLEGYSELAVFDLWLEVLIQPVLFLIIGMSVVAGTKTEYAPVKKVTDGLLTIFGLTILIFVTLSLITNWGSLNKTGIFLQLALPIWMTIGALPYVFFIGILSAYEQAFFRSEWKKELGFWERLRNRFVIFASFHVRPARVGSFAGLWAQRLGEAKSFREGRQVVREFRQAKANEARAAAEAQARLIEFAGVQGTDDEGRQLDQREFEETKDALRWLATCQMGWHRNEGRYRADLLEILGDDFSYSGLARPSGISLTVSSDGDSWYAWRRTITGWCFAIGAQGPPPDQWEYDGATPPSGFPGEDPAWGTNAFSDHANKNW